MRPDAVPLLHHDIFKITPIITGNQIFHKSPLYPLWHSLKELDLANRCVICVALMCKWPWHRIRFWETTFWPVWPKKKTDIGFSPFLKSKTVIRSEEAARMGTSSQTHVETWPSWFPAQVCYVPLSVDSRPSLLTVHWSSVRVSRSVLCCTVILHVW